MRSLCVIVALMTVAIASPVDESVVYKRIVAGLLGGDKGGLVGGLLGEGGLVGGLLGDKEGGLVGSLIGGEGGFLGDIIGVVGSLLQTVLGLISGLTGKTSQPDIYAEFRKLPLEKLCPVCDRLQNPTHIKACHQYCQEQNYSG